MPPAFSSICTVAALDHFVLTVKNIQTTVAFYQRLGMRHELFRPVASPNEVRHSLRYGVQKINLHQVGNEYKPGAGSVARGSADLCFLVDENVVDVKSRLQKAGIELLLNGEIVQRTGARGDISSVYIRDPDGNLIELSNYE